MKQVSFPFREATSKRTNDTDSISVQLETVSFNCIYAVVAVKILVDMTVKLTEVAEEQKHCPEALNTGSEKSWLQVLVITSKYSAFSWLFACHFNPSSYKDVFVTTIVRTSDSISMV
jgi:predicted dinucleotide-binding enzyme